MFSSVKAEVMVEVVCKPICLRNKENLIIWVMAQSKGQVESVLEPLEAKIMSIKELPKGLAQVAVMDADFFLPDDGRALLHVVAKRTGTSIKVSQEEDSFDEQMVG